MATDNSCNFTVHQLLIPAQQLVLSARQHANLVLDDVLAQVLDVEAVTGL